MKKIFKFILIPLFFITSLFIISLSFGSIKVYADSNRVYNFADSYLKEHWYGATQYTQFKFTNCMTGANSTTLKIYIQNRINAHSQYLYYVIYRNNNSTGRLYIAYSNDSNFFNIVSGDNDTHNAHHFGHGPNHEATIHAEWVYIDNCSSFSVGDSTFDMGATAIHNIDNIKLTNQIWGTNLDFIKTHAVYWNGHLDYQPFIINGVIYNEGDIIYERLSEDLIYSTFGAYVPINYNYDYNFAVTDLLKEFRLNFDLTADIEDLSFLLDFGNYLPMEVDNPEFYVTNYAGNRFIVNDLYIANQEGRTILAVTLKALYDSGYRKFDITWEFIELKTTLDTINVRVLSNRYTSNKFYYFDELTAVNVTNLYGFYLAPVVWDANFPSKSIYYSSPNLRYYIKIGRAHV